MRINSSGNLGRTSSPVAKLHAENSSGEAFRITKIIILLALFFVKHSLLTKAIVIQQDTTKILCIRQ